MYVTYIEKQSCLQFLPVYKLSQDHLETFFGAIRSKGGFNNDPTVNNFIAAYKRLLCHSKIKICENGNCLELEKIAVLSTMSTIDKINSSSNYNKIFKELAQDGSYVNIHKQESDFEEELVILDNTASLSQLTMMIVTYISGHVVKKLSKKINCHICVQSLLTISSEVFYNTVIIKRDYSKTGDGYLTYPSNNVVTLCCSAEHYFRENFKKKKWMKLFLLKVC